MKTLFQTLCYLDSTGDVGIDSIINIFACAHGLDQYQDRDDIIALIADTTNDVNACSPFNIVATGSCGVPQQTSGKGFME